MMNALQPILLLQRLYEIVQYFALLMPNTFGFQVCFISFKPI